MSNKIEKTYKYESLDLIKNWKMWNKQVRTIIFFIESGIINKFKSNKFNGYVFKEIINLVNSK